MPTRRFIFEQRIVNEGTPTPADREAIRNVVDSQQPGLEPAVDGQTVHVLF